MGNSKHYLIKPGNVLPCNLLPSLLPAGELMTTAAWVRQFLTSHPTYKQDSVVNEEMTFDLIKRMQEISEGVAPCPELTGKLASKTPDTYEAIV